MIENYKRQILLLLITLFIGLGLGWLSFLLFGDQASNCKILYVSQFEILRFEKERIDKAKDYNLFYGQIDKAIEYIRDEASKHRDKKHKVILTNDEHLSGEGVESISYKVYRGVIKRFKNDLAVSASKDGAGMQPESAKTDVQD